MTQIQQEVTFDLEEYTTKLHEVLNEISCLHRKALEQYVKAGKLLQEIKEHLPHGKWLLWLKQEGISSSKAELYMKVAKNPERYKEADFNLANVRTNSQALRISDDGREAVEEVIQLIGRLDEAIKWLSEEDKQNSELKHSLDYLHAKLHRMKGLCPVCIDVPKWVDGVCPNCDTEEAEIIAEEQAKEREEIEEYQERAKAEVRWEELTSHPAYVWSQVLVIKSGKNRGELQDSDWLRLAYSRGYDTLAQESGYEGNHVPYIGRAPSCELMPDDRLMHDLREAFWLGLQLKEKAKELGLKLKPIDIRGRLPHRNKLVPRMRAVKVKARTVRPGQSEVCLKCRWHKYCTLQPRDECSYFARKRQRYGKQLPLLRQYA